MVIKGKHLLCGSILILCLIGGGLFLYFQLRPTEENKIRFLCSSFTEQICKRGKEGAIPAAGRAQKASRMFAGKSYFSVEGLSWGSEPRSGEKLKGDIFRARALFNTVTLSFEDLEIKIDPSETKAEITLTAVLRGQLKSGGNLYEIRHLKGFLVKESGEWRFESFQAQKLIRQ